MCQVKAKAGTAICIWQWHMCWNSRILIWVTATLQHISLKFAIFTCHICFEPSLCLVCLRSMMRPVRKHSPDSEKKRSTETASSSLPSKQLLQRFRFFFPWMPGASSSRKRPHEACTGSPTPNSSACRSVSAHTSRMLCALYRLQLK